MIARVISIRISLTITNLTLLIIVSSMLGMLLIMRPTTSQQKMALCTLRVPTVTLPRLRETTLLLSRKTYQTIALVKKFDYQLRVIHWIGLWVHSMRQVITAMSSIGAIQLLMKMAGAHPMSFISRQFHWLITSGRGETHSQMRRKIGMPIAQKILNRQLSLVK